MRVVGVTETLTGGVSQAVYLVSLGIRLVRGECGSNVSVVVLLLEKASAGITAEEVQVQLCRKFLVDVHQVEIIILLIDRVHVRVDGSEIFVETFLNFG